jgi:hypothetical protein
LRRAPSATETQQRDLPDQTPMTSPITPTLFVQNIIVPRHTTGPHHHWMINPKLRRAAEVLIKIVRLTTSDPSGTATYKGTAPPVSVT